MVPSSYQSACCMENELEKGKDMRWHAIAIVYIGCYGVWSRMVELVIGLGSKNTS